LIQQSTSMEVKTQWEQSCSNGNLVNPILGPWPLCHGNWWVLSTVMMQATSKPSLFKWRYSLGALIFLVYLSSSIQTTTVCTFSSRKSHPLSEFCACATSWLSTISERLSMCLAQTMWYQISSLGHGRVARAPLHSTCWYNQSLHDCPVYTVYSARYIRQ